MTLYGEKSETMVPASATQPNSVNRSLSWRVATNLLTSFQYAWHGVIYAFRTQRNFRIHAVVGSGVICLAIALNLPLVELAVVILTSGVVLTLELINTALESVVDLTVEQTYHELAKIAKDCAAGAVLISALIAVAVAACLLLPPLWTLLIA